MFSFPTHQAQLSAHMPKSDVDGCSMGNTSATSSLYEQRGSVETVQAAVQRPSTANSSLSERDGPQIQRIKNTLFNSNLPILRRARSNLRKPSETPPVPQEATPSKFLDIPNSSSAGQMVRDDSTFANPFSSPPDNFRLGVEVSITGGLSKPKKSSFAERAAKFSKGAFSPENRQIWRSASNRASSVEPATGNMPSQSNYTLVRTPSRNILDSGGSGGLSSDTSETRSQHKKQSMPSDEAELKQTPSSVLPCDETFKPIPPLKITKQRPKSPAQPQISSPPSQGPLSEQTSPISSNTNNRTPSHSPTTDQVIRKPLVSQGADCENVPPPQSPEMGHYNANQPKSHFSWTTYADSVVDTDDRPSPENQHRGPQRGPTSHFSWSTVNTNTTCQTEDSPSSSPPAFTNSLQSSMMARRRPVPGHEPGGRRHVSAGQAVAPDSPLALSVGRRYASAAQAQPPTKPRNLSIAEHPAVAELEGTPAVAELEGTPVSPTDKALPLPPNMPRGGSPIEVLESQRDDLGVQHANLQKVIVELQKLDLASPLEVDEKSRRKNRKKLAEFKEKLDEVQREEHAVGMALARAVRRAERAEGAESSGLWLRRVTG